MFRCLRKSVKPPVPSPTSSGVALVCTKSACEAYTMIGLRSWNWWLSTRDSRALALVEVDVEMLRLDDLEVERLVLDLVLAEVLGREASGGAEQEAEQRR